MQLVFVKSGDSLSLDFFHNRLTDLWLSELYDANSLTFSLREGFRLSVTAYSQELLSLLDKSNEQLTRMGLQPIVFNAELLLTQDTLNSIHKQWVSICSKYPNIHRVMTKFNLNFRDINELVHAIEQLDHTSIEFENIGTNGKALANATGKMYRDCLSYGTSHIKVEYHNLGRSSCNTWETDDLVCDINDYDSIRFDIAFTLAKPRTNVPHPEYVQWCQAHSIEPFPDYLPLANFKDYQTRMADLRHIVYRNIINDPQICLTG